MIRVLATLFVAELTHFCVLKQYGASASEIPGSKNG